MNQVRILAYGIALSSLVVGSSIKHHEHKSVAASTDMGSLTLVANGEDFVRQGFISKDGWEINFDRLYVNFSNAEAYSTESSFAPQKGDTKDSIEYQNKAEFLDSSQTIDLAEGGTDADPVVVAKANVPTGFYNALNRDALGFEPLAKLVSNGTLQLNDTELTSQLSEPEDRQLTEAIVGLGHVGEGHCVVNK